VFLVYVFHFISLLYSLQFCVNFTIIFSVLCAVAYVFLHFMIRYYDSVIGPYSLEFVVDFVRPNALVTVKHRRNIALILPVG